MLSPLALARYRPLLAETPLENRLEGSEDCDEDSSCVELSAFSVSSEVFVIERKEFKLLLGECDEGQKSSPYIGLT